MTTTARHERTIGANRRLAKVAVQCTAAPETSGWLIKVWFSASTFVVKIATFAKCQNVRHKFKMTVGQIIITDRPTSILENKVVKFLIGLVVIPPVIIFAILAVIYVVISDFITKKILGRPDKPIEYKEKVLFKNQDFKLIEEDISFGSDSDKLAEDFMWSIVDNDDEIYVFKVVADNETFELDKSFLTQFKLETEYEIFLQRITEKEDKPFSELISLDKKTGKTITSRGTK